MSGRGGGNWPEGVEHAVFNPLPRLILFKMCSTRVVTWWCTRRMALLGRRLHPHPSGEIPMPDRMRTTAPTSADGDGGGLVAGKTLLDAIEIRFRLANAGPSPLSVDGRQLGHGLPRRRT